MQQTHLSLENFLQLLLLVENGSYTTFFKKSTILARSHFRIIRISANTTTSIFILIRTQVMSAFLIFIYQEFSILWSTSAAIYSKVTLTVERDGIPTTTSTMCKFPAGLIGLRFYNWLIALLCFLVHLWLQNWHYFIGNGALGSATILQLQNLTYSLHNYFTLS